MEQKQKAMKLEQSKNKKKILEILPKLKLQQKIWKTRLRESPRFKNKNEREKSWNGKKKTIRVNSDGPTSNSIAFQNRTKRK